MLWFKLGESVMEHDICMYVNVGANSVTLHLYAQHDFYIIIFKMKHKFYIASESAPSNEKFWVCTWSIANQLLIVPSSSRLWI